MDVQRRVWMCGLVWLFAALQALAGPKKLIEFGTDRPRPTYVAAHLADMEQLPFDGVCMYLPGANLVFVNRSHTTEVFKNELIALATMPWGRFTDNFLLVNAQTEIDFADDAQWQHALDNVAFNARAATLGRCKGLFFDIEPYAVNPWKFSTLPNAKTTTFAVYQALMEKRGAEFMRAIQAEMPAPVINILFVAGGLETVIAIRDANARARALATHPYGLLPAFVSGMLRAANPNTVIIDGNEFAYFYQTPKQFFTSLTLMRSDAQTLFSRDVQPIYRAVMHCGQAIYPDEHFNLRTKPTLAACMTADERQAWFGSNLYYALQTADDYTWIYSNSINWWTKANLPPGTLDTITAVRQKIAGNRALGYDVTKLISTAQRRQRTLTAP